MITQIFKLEIYTGNAAFEPDAAAELARLLRVAATSLERGYESNVLRDLNGNTVGHWSLSAKGPLSEVVG